MIILKNPWVFLTALFWIIAGIVSICNGNADGLTDALNASVLLGILYVISH